MKLRIKNLTPIICTIMLLGCASVDRALADKKAPLTQKQTNYNLLKEQTTKYVNLSGDKYDSFRNISISGRVGIPIEIPVDSNGSGSFIMQGASRVLPVNFECDYQKGETKGELTISYQDPRNLYGRIFAVIEARCTPLSADEQKAQIESEKEFARITEERRIAAKLAQEKRELERKENERVFAEKENARQIAEAREQAIQNSPQFKRNEAQQSIKRLRQQINWAQKNMNEERKVGMVSGYVNASKLHELGSLVVAAENEIQKQWKIYKENGGQAGSISEIK